MNTIQNEKKELVIDTIILKNGAMVYRAINNALRQRILRHLHKNGKMVVSNIYRELKIEQSVASQHLSILRTADFVRTRREGKYIIYYINYDRLNQLHHITKDLLHKPE